MTILTSCFPFRRLQRPLVVRASSSFGKGDQPSFVVSVEHLFNPLAGFLDESSSSNRILDNRWKTSQVELSHLSESDSEDETRSNVSGASTISTIVPSPLPRPRQVWFAQEEKVALIPSHRDLTDSEWNDLFVGCDEIDENARRNRIEWRFEGGDYMNVLEEEQLVLCSDGNRYHPITVQIHLRSLKEQKQQQQQQRLQTTTMMMMHHKAREQQVAAAVSGMKRKQHTQHPIFADITNVMRASKKSRTTVAALKSTQHPVRRRKAAVATRRHKALEWAGLSVNQ
jgi:hypothetical protein